MVRVTKIAHGATQQEADELAEMLAKQEVLDDINQHGQEYADTHGTCTKKKVTITSLP